MRFLVDAHHIGARATGNETWAVEVSSALSRLLQSGSGGDELLLAVTDSRLAPPEADVVVVHANAGRRLLWDLPAAIRRSDVDAVLVQYTAPLTSAPTVVAIHDLSFTRPESREWIPPLERLRMQATIRWSARHADRVVALSDYTAMDLHDTWGIDMEKIVVAHPAVGRSRAQRLRDHDRPGTVSDGPMVILAVGNVLPRKNLLVLAEATVVLRNRGWDVMLHVVGPTPPAGRKIRAAMEQACGDHVIFSGYVDESVLVSAYQSAHVFCFPSLYEGFGLPVLEAMTAGLPAIVSSATALPEAAGNAAMIVDPHDREGWADAIQSALFDGTMAASMREQGTEHAARFTWESTAKKVLGALYEATA